MARSRSSFELDGAIATATSLRQSEPPAKPGGHYAGVQLVSFRAAVAPPTMPPVAPTARAGTVDPPAEEVAQPDPALPGPAQAGPPKLPDLSGVVSPILRCEKIVTWIAE